MTSFFIKQKLYLRSSKGFTLIELMVVVAILGTLAAIAIPNYISYRQRAILVSIVSEFKNIETSVFVFSADNGRLPDTLAEAGLGAPKDPWGNPYVYYPMSNVPAGVKIRKDRSLHPLNTDFDLYSLGADGRSVAPLTAKASHDDIIRASNGGYYGYAENY
jgi:general secretion pathway protein G